MDCLLSCNIFCRYVEDNAIDMLVLGRCGMSAVKRALDAVVGVGSVSRYCVHHASCAVAVVQCTAEAAASSSYVYGAPS